MAITHVVHSFTDMVRTLNPTDLTTEDRANLRALQVELEWLLAEPESQDVEPDIDDEPPPDYGPPGSGAVITEYD